MAAQGVVTKPPCGGKHDARSHVLCSLKLPTTRHRAVGGAQAPAKHRRPPSHATGRRLRSGAGRQADLLEETERPVPRAEGDPGSDSRESREHLARLVPFLETQPEAALAQFLEHERVAGLEPALAAPFHHAWLGG